MSDDATYPTLRPRMLKILDAHGVIDRVNIGKIVRWWRETNDSGGDGTTIVCFDDNSRENYPDPQGQVDDAICAAFFDVTAADLT